MARCSRCNVIICRCQLVNGLCPTCVAATSNPTPDVPQQQPKQELSRPVRLDREENRSPFNKRAPFDQVGTSFP